MLITLCYSVLTWMQSRQRTEIVRWVHETLLVHPPCSIVFIRDPDQLTSGASLTSRTDDDSSRSDSLWSTGWSADSSRASSAFSTPRKDPPDLSLLNRGPLLRKSRSFDCSYRQISELCRNHSAVRLRRLLWQEDNTRALVLLPRQVVDLHEWSAFKGSGHSGQSVGTEEEFHILLEAEPGLIQRQQYRKFTQFGEIVAWRCGSELGLILRSDLSQVIELMHIFRLGDIILHGGWRVYRLTTIAVEGAIGSLISRVDFLGEQTSLTPGDLRRLSATNRIPRPTAMHTGIFERVADSAASTPKSLSKDTSKHDITTISEEPELDSRLPNWHDRSPRKRSVATLPSFEVKSQGIRHRSLCSSSLSSGGKASSLASLSSAKALSVEEEEEPTRVRPIPPRLLTSVSSSKSHESLLHQTTPHLLSPMSTSQSASSSPRRSMSNRRSPVKRGGKPPNILVLCSHPEKREEIGQILKSMLSNDRYAVYDIRWDQLGVGGWSEATALLVVAGHIPGGGDVQTLLQFLGDGGRLLGWCCAPFGSPPLVAVDGRKVVLEYGERVTHPLSVCALWSSFQKILETNDSEGYSRPLTVSPWAKVKGSGESAVLQFDGGALGGKAMLSQIQFGGTEEGSLSLLSLLLSQHLGVDCTQIKCPEYTQGYLLGEHTRVLDFLRSTPGKVEQAELLVEFTPLGDRGSAASHLCLPVHYFQCPQRFSTLHYFENLETKELGRLVIYADTMTSTSYVLNGHPLRHGLVVIANRQTGGRGRGKNVWLSPEGCAVFSLQLHLLLDSPAGRRLSLLQHLAALAVILAIPNHKEIGLGVKWPNDIYLGEEKVGGILVESRLEGERAVVNIGIGVNVSNPYPTVCLNTLLHPDFTPGAKSKKFLTTEVVVARTLTELEKLLSLLDLECGIDGILSLYEENWVHGEEEEVSVEVAEGVYASCRISGVDQYGFLRVVEVKSGHVLSVRPDGNSFDIANRLIAIKY